MTTRTISPAETIGAVPGKKARALIRGILSAAGISAKTLAQAVVMAESQLNRMASPSTRSVKVQTLQPIQRAAKLVDAARDALSEQGVKRWLNTPNPYLNDVAPILCLRSDKELEKVLSLLAAIRYGLPA